jgi:hypothetical protein
MFLFFKFLSVLFNFIVHSTSLLPGLGKNELGWGKEENENHILSFCPAGFFGYLFSLLLLIAAGVNHEVRVRNCLEQS